MYMYNIRFVTVHQIKTNGVASCLRFTVLHTDSFILYLCMFYLCFCLSHNVIVGYNNANYDQSTATNTATGYQAPPQQQQQPYYDPQQQQQQPNAAAQTQQGYGRGGGGATTGTPQAPNRPYYGQQWSGGQQ